MPPSRDCPCDRREVWPGPWGEPDRRHSIAGLLCRRWRWRGWPSGLNATPKTPPVWPARTANSRGWLRSMISHSRTVISELAGGQDSPIRTERHTRDGVLMAGERSHLARVADVGDGPQPSRPIGAGGGQHVTVGAESHRTDSVSVATKDRQRPRHRRVGRTPSSEPRQCQS